MKSNLAQQTKTDNQVFISGDVVVYMSDIDIDGLKTVTNYQSENHYWLECGQCVQESWIRIATVAELKVKRRLTTSELSIAEVS